MTWTHVLSFGLGALWMLIVFITASIIDLIIHQGIVAIGIICITIDVIDWVAKLISIITDLGKIVHCTTEAIIYS